MSLGYLDAKWLDIYASPLLKYALLYHARRDLGPGGELT
jgi:hypothetical protein